MALCIRDRSKARGARGRICNLLHSDKRRCSGEFVNAIKMAEGRNALGEALLIIRLVDYYDKGNLAVSGA